MFPLHGRWIDGRIPPKSLERRLAQTPDLIAGLRPIAVCGAGQSQARHSSEPSFSHSCRETYVSQAESCYALSFETPKVIIVKQ